MIWYKKRKQEEVSTKWSDIRKENREEVENDLIKEKKREGSTKWSDIRKEKRRKYKMIWYKKRKEKEVQNGLI